MDITTKIGLSVFGWLAFCGFFLIVSWLVTFFHLFRLLRYLKKNEYQKWKEITSIGNIGPGLSNPYRAWSYIFQNTNEDDLSLIKLN